MVRPLSASTAAGVFVGGMGVLVLAGWALGASALKSLVPGLPPMPANTAFDPGQSTPGWVCVPNGNAGSACTFATRYVSL